MLACRDRHGRGPDRHQSTCTPRGVPMESARWWRSWGSLVTTLAPQGGGDDQRPGRRHVAGACCCAGGSCGVGQALVVGQDAAAREDAGHVRAWGPPRQAGPGATGQGPGTAVGGAGPRHGLWVVTWPRRPSPVAFAARYSTRPPCRATSRETTEGSRPTSTAISFRRSPSAMPREISSLSVNVNILRASTHPAPPLP